MVNPEQLKKDAKLNYKANEKFLHQLRKKKNQRLVDKTFHEAHDKVFACTDCLKCANCCTTTGPLFTDKDVARIAKHFRMKDVDFVKQYLRVDEDDDYVLKKVPCTFLEEDNYCSIYDIRPKACREYPHTDDARQVKYFKLTMHNTAICPAVNDILDEVKKKLQYSPPSK